MQGCWSFPCSSLDPLAHCRNVPNLSLFYRYYSVTELCSSELAELIQHPYSQGKSTLYYDLIDFSVTIPRCYKDIYVNSFFPDTAYTLEFSAYGMLSFDL